MTDAVTMDRATRDGATMVPAVMDRATRDGVMMAPAAMVRATRDGAMMALAAMVRVTRDGAMMAHAGMERARRRGVMNVAAMALGRTDAVTRGIANSFQAGGAFQSIHLAVSRAQKPG